MGASLKIPAPSATLLKFLRSQSEGIYFFSPNLRPNFAFDHAAPRNTHARRPPARRPSITSTRTLCTSQPQYTTLEAGFPILDFLFPRASSTTFHPENKSSYSLRRPPRRDWNTLGARYGSSHERRWWQLFGGRSPRSSQPLHPDDLPNGNFNEESGDSMFSLGRRISAKAAAQPKLRCTELDENGNIILTSGEFKKSELIQKVRKHNNCWRNGKDMADEE